MNEAVAKTKRLRIVSFSQSLISKATLVLGLLTAGVFLFTFTGRYFFLAELASHFRFQMMLSLFGIGVASTTMKRYRLASLLVLLALIATSGTLSMRYPIARPVTKLQTLKLMSFNVLFTNRNYKSVIDEIVKHNPDVVTILEYSRKWESELALLRKTHPYVANEPRQHTFGVAIYSRYPLTKIKKSKLPAINIDNPFLSTVVSFDDQSIRLAAVHAYSPTSKARLSFRNQQFKKVAELLGSSDTPTVVVGDFNCTPWSPFLKDFQKRTGLSDSRRGFGNQATWPTQSRLLRIPIDQAFVSPNICVHNRFVGGATSSDHLPIILEISTEITSQRN